MSKIPEPYPDLGIRGFIAAIGLAAALGVACEQVTHANIDKWRSTEQGPRKLVSALKNGDIDADLRAHAAQALVGVGHGQEAQESLQGMAGDNRTAVIAKLVVRLWTDAKLVDVDFLPRAAQLRAKDALFHLRVLADTKALRQIDDFLLEWYLAGGHYEQVALLPTIPGYRVMQALGSQAAPRLVSHARVLHAEQKNGAEYTPLGPQLLYALAWTASAEAVGFLLDLAEKPHKQADLQGAAMLTLYEVYAKNHEEQLISPRALEPHVPRLVQIGKDVSLPDGAAEAAYDLLALLPRDKCLPALLAMVTQADVNLRWRAVQYGLKCGGLDAILPLAEALRQDERYPQGIIVKYFVRSIPDELRPKSLPQARALLGSHSWVARLLALELLAEVGSRDDVPALRRLKSDRTVLKGFSATGKDPRLGERAEAVAKLLEKRS